VPGAGCWHYSSASSPDMKLWMVTLLLTIGNTVGHAQDEVSDM
jgi:hypothetical protein